MKIDLFCVMEKVGDIHPVLEEVIMDSAMKVMDLQDEKVNSNGIKYYSPKLLTLHDLLIVAIQVRT